MNRLSHLLAYTLAAIFGLTGHADILLVCQNGCQYSSIADAIAAADDGDTIQLIAETYEVDASISLQGKAVRLVGTTDSSGAPASIIDGQGSVQIFVCDSGEQSSTILDTLVIQNGYSPSGPSGGGAVLIDSTSPSFLNCHFIDNTSDLWGGAVSMIQNGAGPTQPTFTNCLFHGNAAGAGGAISGGLFVEPAIATCTFSMNTAIQGGGLWFTGVSSTTVSNCTFSDNTAAATGPNESPEGGAVYTAGIVLSNCVLSGNTPDGLYNFSNGLKGAPTPVRLVDTIICGNTDGDSSVQVTGIVEHVGETRIHPRCEDSFDLGDLDQDGDVDPADWELLGHELGICPADLNLDGIINGKDVGLLFTFWGPCLP